MNTFLIPFRGIPETFEISLAGKLYYLTVKWNDSDEGGWTIDLSDANTDTVLAANLPLITGANVLAGLNYLGFDGEMVIFTDGDETAVPTFDNLGVESNLYFQTDVLDNG